MIWNPVLVRTESRIDHSVRQKEAGPLQVRSCQIVGITFNGEFDVSLGEDRSVSSVDDVDSIHVSRSVLDDFCDHVNAISRWVYNRRAGNTDPGLDVVGSSEQSEQGLRTLRNF